MSRELDAEIAKLIFGIDVWHDKFGPGHQGFCPFEDRDKGVMVKPYSTSIADAFLVVEKMREKGFSFDIMAYQIDKTGWEAEFWKAVGEIHGSYTNSPSLAICEAALSAMKEGKPNV